MGRPCRHLRAHSPVSVPSGLQSPLPHPPNPRPLLSANLRLQIRARKTHLLFVGSPAVTMSPLRGAARGGLAHQAPPSPGGVLPPSASRLSHRPLPWAGRGARGCGSDGSISPRARRVPRCLWGPGRSREFSSSAVESSSGSPGVWLLPTLQFPGISGVFTWHLSH